MGRAVDDTADTASRLPCAMASARQVRRTGGEVGANGGMQLAGPRPWMVIGSAMSIHPVVNKLDRTFSATHQNRKRVCESTLNFRNDKTIFTRRKIDKSVTCIF